MNTHRIKEANDIPDAQPAGGQYDENEIRVGVLRDVVERQRAEIAAKDAEIARLGQCIRELEREGLEEPYRGFKNYDAFANAREWAESPHSDHQDGRVDNTTGAFAHIF